MYSSGPKYERSYSLEHHSDTLKEGKIKTMSKVNIYCSNYFKYLIYFGEQEKGATEDEMVGWHHQLNGHEFEQAPEVGDGQGSLACCSPWGHRVRLD